MPELKNACTVLTISISLPDTGPIAPCTPGMSDNRPPAPRCSSAWTFHPLSLWISCYDLHSFPTTSATPWTSSSSSSMVWESLSLFSALWRADSGSRRAQPGPRVTAAAAAVAAAAVFSFQLRSGRNCDLERSGRGRPVCCGIGALDAMRICWKRLINCFWPVSGAPLTSYAFSPTKASRSLPPIMRSDRYERRR